MTRAKDISKIVTDANFSGTLDVAGAVTGTLATAAQPNVTSVGTLTSFRSTGIDDNANALAITIDSSERVMIGTTTEGQVEADDLTIATTSNTGITIRSGTSHNGAIYFSDGTSGADEYRGWVDYDHSNNSLKFATNAAERIRIDPVGKVGIGETSPNAGLQITSTNNDINKIRLAYANTSHYMEIGRLAGSYRIASFENGQALSFGTTASNGATTERMRIDSAGKVGIGTASPSQLLEIHGASNPAVLIKDTTNNCISYMYSQDSVATFGSASNHPVVFNVNNGEKVRIDAAGRMMIGTTVEGESSASQFTLAGSGHSGITIRSGTSSRGAIFFSDGTHGDAEYRGIIDYSHGTNGFRFFTNSVQRFAIDSGGRLGVTSHIDVTDGIYLSSLGNGGIAIQTTATQNHAYVAYKMRNSSGGQIGSIACSTSATAYNTSSDYRLKENVVTNWDATTRLKQLKPSRFNFILDADTTVDGFLAHEVSSIVPEAITGTKDDTESMTNVVLNANGTRLTDDVTQEKWVAGKLSTTDENGNTVDPIYSSDTTWVASKTVPKYQGIDQSKLVPLLVKTIQELEARITALEGA